MQKIEIERELHGASKLKENLTYVFTFILSRRGL